MERTAAEIRAILAELKQDTDDVIRRFRYEETGGQWKRAYLPEVDVVVDAYTHGRYDGWKANIYIRGGGPRGFCNSIMSHPDTWRESWAPALRHIRHSVLYTLKDWARVNKRDLPDLAADLAAAAETFDPAALKFWDMMKEHHKRKGDGK